MSGWEAHLYSHIWLIGGWLRRRAAGSLAQAAQRGDAGAARALAEAVTRSDDPAVREVALQALRSLDAPACVDAACAVWATTRHGDLAALLVARRWVARAPAQVRVLSALKAGQPEALASDGAEVVEPLIAASSDPDAEIAQQALPALRGLRTPDAARGLAEVAAGGGDARAREIARKTLRRLTAPPSIDAVCAVWAATRNPDLAGLMVKSCWVATAPVSLRVATALKVKRPEVVAEGEAEVVEPLIEACADADRVIAERARLALRRLKNAQAREKLCRLVLDDDHPVAREAAVEGRYAPRDEHRRALLFFLTEQWDRYEALDFDRRLLRTVYESADAALRQRITEKLRAAGRTDFLTVIVGADYRSRAGAITSAEAQFLVQMLAANGEWEKLWRLSADLSFEWSVRIVQILGRSGWKPGGSDERATLERLVSLASGDLAASAEEVSRFLPPAARRASVRVEGRVNDVAFSPTRPVIAIGTGLRKLALWNFHSARIEQQYDSFDHSLGRVNFTNGDVLVCGERTNSDAPCSVYGWVGDHRFRLGAHKGAVTALEPMGERGLLSAGRDGRVVLWDVGATRAVKERDLSPTWARAARVSPDGKQAALLHDGVTLVALPELATLATTSGQLWRGVSQCAAFAPGGSALVAGKFNGDVLVCQRRGKTLEVGVDGLLHRQEGQVRGVEVLPKRAVVVTAGYEGRIQFTSWANRASTGSILLVGEQLSSLHVSPNGAFMATGHSDAHMSLWDLRVAEVPALFGRPLAQAVPMDLAAVSAAAAEAGIDPRVRRSLRFLECLLQHRFRCDIEIDEVTTIRKGDFDIEIG